MKRLAVLLFPLLTIGCAVIKETDRPNLNKLDQTNYQNLNGIYLNYRKDTIGVRSLFWFQIDKYKNWDLAKNWTEQTIRLKFINQRKLQLALYENGRLIKQKNIKGKLKDGYFYRRPFFILYPIVPIIFGYDTQQYRFGLIDTNLILDRKEHYWVCSFGFGEASNKQVTGVFERK